MQHFFMRTPFFLKQEFLNGKLVLSNRKVIVTNDSTAHPIL